ncbi:uncharacterized protein LOC110459148 [Mizuhopecten yessoensis]|uniref:uncharacterized protein LOC110459148 n=1 Tax=Mizuhopecten yessoensis TaxID=6573 RepID=UPI000B45CC78|nr:uncharacterized protein LOC110459148 [Mizuhopecten yessoensis]
MAAPMSVMFTFVFLALALRHSIINNIGAVTHENFTYFSIMKTVYRPRRNAFNTEVKPHLLILFSALLLSGDIQLNPGPPHVYPCGYCEHPVTWDHQRAVCCKGCDIWYHSTCLEMSSHNIEILQRSSVSWLCCKCDNLNVDSFTFHSYELEISNQFSVLSNSATTDIDSIPSPDSVFSPKRYSSPQHWRARSRSTLHSTASSMTGNTTHLPPKQENLRTLIMNCQSVKNKTAEFETLVDYIKPDIIIGNESWLANDIGNSEIFPPEFQQNVYRKDRNKHGGGVFIAVEDNLITCDITSSEDCEVTWCKLTPKQGKPLIIGSFYRPPNTGTQTIEELRSSIQSLGLDIDNHSFILAGDFNLSNMDWENSAVTSGTSQPQVHQEVLNLLDEFSLSQIQDTPTREGNILDLYITNNTTLVKNCQVIPGISDHHSVVVDADIKPHYIINKRRKIFSYKKADWNSLEEHLSRVSDSVVNSTTTDIDTLWTILRKGITEAMESFIPSKLSSKYQSHPWITHNIKKLIKKKHRYYIKAKQSGSKELWNKYKREKRETQKTIRKSHWVYVNTVLETSLTTGNRKTFWKYVKSKKKDNIGVAPHLKTEYYIKEVVRKPTS